MHLSDFFVQVAHQEDEKMLEIIHLLLRSRVPGQTDLITACNGLHGYKLSCYKKQQSRASSAGSQQ